MISGLVARQRYLAEVATTGVGIPSQMAIWFEPS